MTMTAKGKELIDAAKAAHTPNIEWSDFLDRIDEKLGRVVDESEADFIFFNFDPEST